MSKEHNIIFLDIDGVLNGYNYWNLLGWNIVSKTHIKKLINWYKKVSEPFGVHESKVKILAKIVHDTGAKIVMSSSWRHSWWNTPYEKQLDEQKKLTDLFKKYNIEVIDITAKSTTNRRDKEIATWLSRHEDNVNNFIIIDDEKCLFYEDRLILTTSVIRSKVIKKLVIRNTGLKRKHIKQAIKLFKQ